MSLPTVVLNHVLIIYIFKPCVSNVLIMIRNLFQEISYWFMDQHIYVHCIISIIFYIMLIALFKILIHNAYSNCEKCQNI